MKKTEEKKGKIRSMASIFFNALFSTVKERVERGGDAIYERFEEKVILLQKKMLRHIFIMICILIGIISLLLALSFYLIDALHWPRYIIFLILGALLLIIASVYANFQE